MSTIQRYACDDAAAIRPGAFGPYVSHSDHLAEISRLQSALSALTRKHHELGERESRYRDMLKDIVTTARAFAYGDPEFHMTTLVHIAAHAEDTLATVASVIPWPPSAEEGGT